MQRGDIDLFVVREFVALRLIEVWLSASYEGIVLETNSHGFS